MLDLQGVPTIAIPKQKGDGALVLPISYRQLSPRPETVDSWTNDLSVETLPGKRQRTTLMEEAKMESDRNWDQRPNPIVYLLILDGDFYSSWLESDQVVFATEV